MVCRIRPARVALGLVALCALAPASASASATAPLPSAPGIGAGFLRSPPLAAAAAARTTTFAGSTRQDDPIVFVLSRDRRRVERVVQEWEAPCGTGVNYVYFDDSLSAKVAANGRFSRTVVTTESLSGNLMGAIVETVKGRVKGGKLTGAVTAHVAVGDASGNIVDTCQATTAFTTRTAKGTVFGGTTSGQGPVVVELSSDRLRVKHFHIGWRATCTPDGFFQYGDTLTDFGIVGGRFGGDLSNTLNGPGGESEQIHYTLKGRIRSSALSGTFRLRFTDLDAAGATVRSCDTGTISFKGASG